jgi:hypothetical protein
VVDGWEDAGGGMTDWRMAVAGVMAKVRAVGGGERGSDVFPSDGEEGTDKLPFKEAATVSG